jgi:multimeric flavodoxin WrbA
MRIAAVCGSLRQESNTNKLVRVAAEAAGCDCDVIELAGLSIKPCTGCGVCMMNEGKCPIDDDMQGAYETLLAADGFIIGGPTYFMDINGAVKDFIDRSMAVKYRDIGPAYSESMPWLGTVPFNGKPAVLLVTVAGGGHERALETLKVAFDDCHRMRIVAKLAEIVGMNDVDDMPETLERARAAGKKLAAALRA